MNGIDIAGGAVSNAAQARVFRDEIVSLLNSKMGPDYLFSGSSYDILPVDINDPAYTPSAAPTTADTDYYQGNGTLDSVRVSSSLRMSIWCDCGQLCFREKRCAHSISLLRHRQTSPSLAKHLISTGRRLQSLPMCVESSAQKLAFWKQKRSVQATSASYLVDVISGLRDADIAEATVRMSQTDVQLQASYGALSQLLKLRLSDYLR
jgi:flagellar hook-associated protein 3 FlgL